MFVFFKWWNQGKIKHLIEENFFVFYTGKRNVLNWSGLKYKRFSIFMLCSSACYSIDVSQNKCEAGKELSTP